MEPVTMVLPWSLTEEIGHTVTGVHLAGQRQPKDEFNGRAGARVGRETVPVSAPVEYAARCEVLGRPVRLVAQPPVENEQKEAARSANLIHRIQIVYSVGLARRVERVLEVALDPGGGVPQVVRDGSVLAEALLVLLLPHGQLFEQDRRVSHATVRVGAAEGGHLV